MSQKVRHNLRFSVSSTEEGANCRTLVSFEQMKATSEYRTSYLKTLCLLVAIAIYSIVDYDVRLGRHKSISLLSTGC